MTQHRINTQTGTVSTADFQGWDAWLKSKINPENCYLLAHQTDGVNWGRFDAAGWTFSNSIYDNAPVFAPSKLLELRVFHEAFELFVWRTQMGYRWRLIEDVPDGTLACNVLSEAQWLWGSRREAKSNGNFTLLGDGAQGMRHAVPIDVPKDYFIKVAAGKNTTHHPVRLHVNHYVQPDPDTGLATVFASRLVKLDTETLLTPEVSNES